MATGVFMSKGFITFNNVGRVMETFIFRVPYVRNSDPKHRLIFINNIAYEEMFTILTVKNIQKEINLVFI